MNTNKQQGFTLIEMIVATTVFIVVMLIVVSSLISLENASRKARTVRTTTDNLSAAIDSMSRNIRMGSYYHCGCGTAGTPSTVGDGNFPGGTRDCPMTDNTGAGGDACFAFEGQNGDPTTDADQYVYRLSNGRIQRSLDGGVTFVDLTAPEINVTDMHFIVSGTTLDNQQPYVTMILRGKTPLTPTTWTDFNIETTVGSRTPNYSVYTP